MGEISAETQGNCNDSTPVDSTVTSRERCVSDSNVELKKVENKTINGNARHGGEVRRRNFGHNFGKRLRLILRPWKWRRKSKRHGTSNSSQSQRNVSMGIVFSLLFRLFLNKINLLNCRSDMFTFKSVCLRLFL